MATILVDYENVYGCHGLKGADALNEKDILIIFYSNSCEKVRYDAIQEIRESGCRFRVIKLKEAGKNALDFYIAAECGRISEQGEKEIAIISNDKGFQAVIDFFDMDQETADIQIVKAGNIENALAAFQQPGDSNRRSMLQKRKKLLDLATECTKIEKQNKMKRDLRTILEGTEYQEKSAEIIDFVSKCQKSGKKAVYTGSLHAFGRKQGIEIYKLIRNDL